MSMTDDEVKTFVRRAISASVNGDTGDMSEIRQDNFDRYWGEDYGDEVEGRSRVKTREVMEVVEWAKPSLLRIFTQSDNVVSFDPVGPEDVDAAEQETRTVNHVFNKMIDGFTLLYTLIHDALWSPMAYCKIWWDDTDETSIERYHGLTMEQAAMIAQNPDIRILGVESEHGEAGPEFSIEIEVKDGRRGKLRGMAVPQEEVLVDSDLSTWDLDEADFVAHHRRMTASDLIEMGYSKKVVDSLTSADDGDDNSERENRRFTSDEDYDDDNLDDSQREIWVYEVFCKLDYDGDGIAEKRRILYAGGEILENEGCVYQPLIAMSCLPQPHRHMGLDLATMIKDLQRVSTVLTRQTLDNLYKVNNPRPIIGLGVNTEDFLNDAPNAPIRATDINQIRMEPTQPVLGHALPALEWIGDMVQKRSGISDTTMGLDAETLAQSTKGAALGAMEAANQRLELIARVFAETGVKKLMLKIHQLLRMHQNVPLQLSLSGQWTNVDPRQWKKRSDLTVHVGIGNSTREQKLISAEMILQLHERIGKAGLFGQLVSPENVYKAAKLLVEAAGQKNAHEYLTDPKTVPPPQPKPDPQMEAIKATVQVENIKTQAGLQKAHMDNQAKLQSEAMRAAQEREKLEAERQGKVADIRQRREQIAAENARAESKNDTEIRKALINKGEVVELPNLDQMQLDYITALQQALQGMQQAMDEDRAARQAQQSAIRDWIAQNGSTRLKRLADSIGGNQ